MDQNGELAKTLGTLEQQLEPTVTMLGQLQEASEKLNNTFAHAKELSKELEKISRIISETTNNANLLSVNTAIIAEKTESKDGVNVIAKELQTLAEQLKIATEELILITGEEREITHEHELQCQACAKLSKETVATIMNYKKQLLRLA